MQIVQGKFHENEFLRSCMWVNMRRPLFSQAFTLKINLGLTFKLNLSILAISVIVAYAMVIYLI